MIKLRARDDSLAGDIPNLILPHGLNSRTCFNMLALIKSKHLKMPAYIFEWTILKDIKSFYLMVRKLNVS